MPPSRKSTGKALSLKDYSIGVICALPLEAAAFEATLDEIHASLPKVNGDPNSYTFGRTGGHNVILTCFPAGLMGKSIATKTAVHMNRSFPGLKGLMVGIGGGVWSHKNDVRLGDVVVSLPANKHGGVVQWDFGRVEDGGFQRRGSTNKPSQALLNAIQNLRRQHQREGDRLEECLKEMAQKSRKMSADFKYPGSHLDRLFRASYRHETHEGGNLCDTCDPTQLVDRPSRRTTTSPLVHYGTIASGDAVMADGVHRDRIAKEEGAICFEMEAAGLMDEWNCVVIRGICDYCDSHKNDVWQKYAAATAAAVAKELLEEIEGDDCLQTSYESTATLFPDETQSSHGIPDDSLEPGMFSVFSSPQGTVGLPIMSRDRVGQTEKVHNQNEQTQSSLFACKAQDDSRADHKATPKDKGDKVTGPTYSKSSQLEFGFPQKVTPQLKISRSLHHQVESWLDHDSSSVLWIWTTGDPRCHRMAQDLSAHFIYQAKVDDLPLIAHCVDRLRHPSLRYRYMIKNLVAQIEMQELGIATGPTNEVSDEVDSLGMLEKLLDNVHHPIYGVFCDLQQLITEDEAYEKFLTQFVKILSDISQRIKRSKMLIVTKGWDENLSTLIGERYQIGHKGISPEVSVGALKFDPGWRT